MFLIDTYYVYCTASGTMDPENKYWKRGPSLYSRSLQSGRGDKTNNWGKVKDSTIKG